MSFIFILLFVPPPLHAQDISFCEDQHLNKTSESRESDAPACKEINESKSVALASYPDGTKHINCKHWMQFPAQAEEEFKKIQPEIPARTARAKKLFESLKQQYQSVISSDANGDQKKYMKEQMGRLNIKYQKCSNKEAFFARYLPIAHTIIACEQLLLLPEEAMITHLAHEIAHSTDPCYQSKKVRTTVPIYELRDALDQCKLEKNDVIKIVGELNSKKDIYMDGRWIAASSFTNPLLQKLKDCQLIEESKELPIPPSELAGHAFADIFQCTYKETPKESLQHFNYEARDEKDSYRLTGSALLSGHRTPNKQCEPTGAEYYAESVGAYVSSVYLQNHPPRKEYEKSVFFMNQLVSCVLNTQKSSLHVAANDAVMMTLQYEPFQKIANCKLKEKPHVCGRGPTQSESLLAPPHPTTK